jgi:ribosomal protein S10
MHGIQNHTFETILELEGIDRKQLENIESSFIEAVKQTGKSLNIRK